MRAEWKCVGPEQGSVCATGPSGADGKLHNGKLVKALRENGVEQ